MARLPLVDSDSSGADPLAAQVLRQVTGLRGRTGVFIDAVGMLCRPVNANGTLGAETTVGSMAGGGGGNNFIAHGKPGEVVFGARIYSGMYVDAMSLHCQTWDPATRKVFSSGSFVDFGHGGAGTEKTEHCALNKQPVSGIRGRASAVVDAIGLKCDEP